MLIIFFEVFSLATEMSIVRVIKRTEGRNLRES